MTRFSFMCINPYSHHQHIIKSLKCGCRCPGAKKTLVWRTAIFLTCCWELSSVLHFNIESPFRDNMKIRWSWWESLNDDVIKWKHFSRYWPFVQGIHRSPVNFPRKSQWRGALMFSLICAWIKWLNKQPWGWWFEMPSCPLWCHCNDIGKTAPL